MFKKDKYNDLSIRELQVVATFCVAKYCSNFNLKHDCIEEYLLHHLSIIFTENLLEWENKGKIINITGRGDYLPDDFITCIDTKRIKEFDIITQYSTEVGITNLFGCHDTEPLNFLLKVINILKKHNIEIPSLKSIFININRELDSNSHWGNIVSELEYNEIKENLFQMI